MIYFDVADAVKIMSELHPRKLLPPVVWSWKELSAWIKILKIDPFPTEREIREQEVPNSRYPSIEWLQDRYKEFVEIAAPGG